MNLKIRTLRNVGVAIAMSTLVAGVAGAANMKAATGPQAGDCKRAFEAINGQSPQIAQAMWVQMVASKYGNKWAHWVGAKDKAVTPNGNQFMARAKPCFYQPVP